MSAGTGPGGGRPERNTGRSLEKGDSPMYQKIVIVGNLGRDPEMRYTPSGQAVTNFSVATNRQYTSSDGQKVKETVWFRISAWGRQAETCNQYLRSQLIQTLFYFGVTMAGRNIDQLNGLATKPYMSNIPLK